VTVEPADDFCFDEQGNIFTVNNISGEVEIRKYNKTGELVGIMTNDIDTVISHDGYQKIYLGGYIAYLPEIGLFLYDSYWGHIPIEFSPGNFPDMTLNQKKLPEMYASKNTYITRSYETRAIVHLSIHQEGKPVQKLRFEGVSIMGVHIIYSLDGAYQYYDTYTRDYYTDEIQVRVLKYNGEDMLFITDVIPQNLIDYCSGKVAVVDSEGTIYYYCGNWEGIKIFRWVLK
jgi:hypothetical protein